MFTSLGETSLCRYRKFRKAEALYCSNVRTTGSTWRVSAGDFILYRETYVDGSSSERFGRVVALATHDGTGKEYRSEKVGARGRKLKSVAAPRLLVLALSDNMTFAYERHIDKDAVAEVLSPKRRAHLFALLRWMLFGDVSGLEPEAAVRFMHNGSMSDEYIGAYLTGPEGQLRPDWHEVFMGREPPAAWYLEAEAALTRSLNPSNK